MLAPSSLGVLELLLPMLLPPAAEFAYWCVGEAAGFQHQVLKLCGGRVRGRS